MHTLVLLECKQKRIARDDEISFERDGARDDVIVVRVVHDRARDRRRFHYCHDSLIALGQLARCETGGSEGFRQFAIA